MRKILLITMTGILTLLFSACNDWLDVNPKSQIKNDVLFEDEAGFETALYGLYTGMAQPELYGKTLTMTFMDVLAQYYDISSSFHNYADVVKYDYEASTVEGITANIWKSMYKLIMNSNNLLENLEVHPEVFTGNNENLIQGEALAIRAYLHFDLLRMFAPSFAVGKDEPAIPYVDRVTRSPFPQLTNTQVVAKILEDCKKALECLKVSDPFGPAAKDALTDYDVINERKERMNYYAVMALMARVYLWSDNREEAGRISGELITTPGFGVTGPIFWLYSDKVTKYSDEYFDTNSKGENKLILSQEYRDDFYETSLYSSFDRRINSWLVKDLVSTEGIWLVAKYAKGSGSTKNITLLQMGEMYYIHAECVGGSAAFDDLNKVRQNYGILATMDLTVEHSILEEELFKEYRKSFLAEGQLFYYMKRKDFTSIPNVVLENPRKVFCLPIPRQELEFGNLIND